MCDISKMKYARQRMATFKWENGFGYGVINNKTGEAEVWQARSTDGEWVIPSDIKFY